MKLAWIGFVVAMSVAPAAHAIIECTNDTDCAVSGCGGKVCNWI